MKNENEKYENGEYRVDTLAIVGGHLLGEVLVKVVNVEEIDKQRRFFRGDEHPEQPVVVVLAERVLPPELLADGVERGGVGRGVHDVADGGEREALVRRAAAYLLINCSNTSVALSSADVVAACVSMFSMDGRGGVQTSAEEKKLSGNVLLGMHASPVLVRSLSVLRRSSSVATSRSSRDSWTPSTARNSSRS